MYDVSVVSDRWLQCVFLLQHSFLQHSVSTILCMHLFIGLLARVFEACSHILLAGRRHGDMTPSFRNYGINTDVELRQSFLLELRDQHIYGTQTILPIGITGSIQWSFFSELRDLGLYGVTNDPSFRNYEINTSMELRQSFLFELRDQFNDPSFRNYGI